MGKYLLNKETQKIEMHFEKSEYQALSEEQKKEIKSTFLWSNYSKAWVSRSIHYHYRAEQIAKKLGLEDAGSVDERMSYVEELEHKTEKAEAKAERYEQYSDNAEKRAENLQADFNKYRKDWSWLTQPIIAGHAGSQAFGRHKAKVMARYERGFEEYNKSEYYQDKAVMARATADNTKLKDKVYLHNKIKECNKTLKMYQEHIIKYEDALYKIQQGEELKNRSGEILTENLIEERITDRLEKYEWEYNKLEFFEKCLAELGGVEFSRDNIKVGYIVNIKHSGRRCEILSTGPVNVTYKILDGGAAGMVLTDPYAAIVEIVQTKEKSDKVINPFIIGDILCSHYMASGKVYKAYQVIKTTETGVKIQQIAVENNKPIKDNFINEKPMQKKVVKSKFSDFVGLYDDDWQLNKYIEQKEEKAV
jgi:hypothetical protein